MDFNFLPQNFLKAINKIDESKLYELRLKVGFSATVNYSFKKYFLSADGLSNYETSGIKCDESLIKQIIDEITEHSVYAFNDKLKRGFLTTKNGIRVGVAGECVMDGEVETIKNFTSLNIRIPHEIYGCSDKVFPYVLSDEKIYSTLIISPPFCGKTTVLKDVARKLNSYTDKNILLIDERGEFGSVKGVRIDNIKYSDKLFAFNYGVRSMSPDVVITDELCGKDDWICAQSAVNSGVKIIASCHASQLNEVRRKQFFLADVFERYAVLSGGSRAGILKTVYDEKYKEITVNA